jgi:hypothetical protein
MLAISTLPAAVVAVIVVVFTTATLVVAVAPTATPHPGLLRVGEVTAVAQQSSDIGLTPSTVVAAITTTTLAAAVALNTPSPGHRCR